MAFHQLLCGATLVILLTLQGCHSSKPVCGKLMKGQDPYSPLPWQAVITLKEGHQCLGTVVSDRWVLTTGNCGFGPNEGAKVLLAGDGYKKARPVTSYACNSSSAYSKKGGEGLCLLKLSKALVFNGAVGPICLAAKGSAFFSGTWSYTSTGSHKKPTVKVPIVGHNECKCYHPSVQQSQICAGGKPEKAPWDKCKKSVGGALMDHSDMVWTLAGVGGYGDQCLTAESFKTYARVSYFQNWIKWVTASSPPQFVVSRPKGVDQDEKFICPTACNKDAKCESADGCYDLSIFDHGVNVPPSFFLVLVCVLVLSLSSIRW